MCRFSQKLKKIISWPLRKALKLFRKNSKKGIASLHASPSIGSFNNLKDGFRVGSDSCSEAEEVAVSQSQEVAGMEGSFRSQERQEPLPYWMTLAGIPCPVSSFLADVREELGLLPEEIMSQYDLELSVEKPTSIFIYEEWEDSIVSSFGSAVTVEFLSSQDSIDVLENGFSEETHSDSFETP